MKIEVLKSTMYFRQE